MKITFVPNQPHCYAFGGFEIQMLSAFEGLKAGGYDVSLLNSWDRSADFDLVHVWGLEISQAHHIDYARKAGKAIVVTVLMPDLSTWYKRFKFFASSLIYKVRIQKELGQKVDAIIAVSEIEKDLIKQSYGFADERIHVIPNMIGKIYLDGVSAPNDLGISDYVLCTGNICRRKNQLNLVKACNELDLPVLLIGNKLPGEDEYADLVSDELSKNVRSKWIPGVEPNSAVLKAAYQHCRLFALLSYLENQPISILEAQAMGCKILLADRPYTKQTLFKDLLTVDPDSLVSIREGIKLIDNRPAKLTPVSQTCSMEEVTKKHAELYSLCLSRKTKAI